MAAHYRFLTAWSLEAPRTEVFEVIHDAERWPDWWRGVERVQKLEQGDEEGRGSVGLYAWRSVLPYRVEFEMRITRVERPYVLEGEARGELAGIGRWRFYEDAGITTVLYDWDVETTRRWMNVLAPIARPVFKWNHDWLMRQGEIGLAARLRA